DGKVEDAARELKEAVRLSPDNGEARYQLGLALARSGQKDEATSELQKGRELVAADDRTKTASLDILEGRAAFEKGELDTAAAKLRHASQLRPDSAEAHLSLGNVLEKKGDVAGATAAYVKAAELNPGDASARQGLERLRGIGAGAAARAAAGSKTVIRDGAGAEPPVGIRAEAETTAAAAAPAPPESTAGAAAADFAPAAGVGGYCREVRYPG